MEENKKNYSLIVLLVILIVLLIASVVVDVVLLVKLNQISVDIDLLKSIVNS